MGFSTARAAAVPHQYKLLQQKRFLPLFCTQFLGAFNDNLFKNALIILIAFSPPTFSNANTLINICAALFTIPYFLFSALAGEIADKFEKSTLIRLVKLVEIILAVLTLIGFYFNHIIFLMVALFLLGCQATFFGPVKYSVLPQHLKPSELMGGNGLVEMGTFVAILLGTILGAVLMGIPTVGHHWVGGSIVFVAVLGFIASCFIPKAAPYSKEQFSISWKPLQLSWKIMKDTYKNKIIFYGILGISWFWFLGSIFLTQMANYTKTILGGNESVATLPLIAFSIGIGLGSLSCERLAKHKVELGLILLGIIGLTIFAIDFSLIRGTPANHPQGILAILQHPQNIHLLIAAILMGAFGGIYIVPLYAMLQQRSLPENRSRVIAVNNIMNAIFMVLASLFAIVILNMGFSIPQLFLITAILNAGMGLYLSYKVPEFKTSFYQWLKR